MEKNLYRDPATGELLPERRSGVDRREPPSLASLFSRPYRRRRSRGRRKSDPGAYVDLYDARSWGIALAVLIMSCLDALLTGLHLTRGSARELNPLMNAVILYGGLPSFFSVKAAMTVFPVAIILIHKEWALGRFAALACLWAYVLITVYHLYLILLISR